MQDTKTKVHDNRLNFRNLSTASNSIESGNKFSNRFHNVFFINKSKLYVCLSLCSLSVILDKTRRSTRRGKKGVSMDTS